jgi:collagenase-like PrtC family protease
MSQEPVCILADYVYLSRSPTRRQCFDDCRYEYRTVRIDDVTQLTETKPHTHSDNTPIALFTAV